MAAVFSFPLFKVGSSQVPLLVQGKPIAFGDLEKQW